MARVRAAMAVLAVMMLATVAAAQTASVDDIVWKLRGGGYVIVLRHGATHNDQADTDPLNFDNVAKQRQLNDKGRADARALGDVFRRARGRNGAAGCRQGARSDGRRLRGGPRGEPKREQSPDPGAARAHRRRARRG